MKKLAMVVLISTLGTAAKAETALTQLGAMANVEISRAPIFVPPASDAGGAGEAQPLPGPDALGVCMMLNDAAKPGLQQAAVLVQGCLDQAYQQGVWSEKLYSLKAEPGRFMVPLCPSRNKGEVACQAFVEVEGIVITLKGKLRKGDETASKLAASLARRKNLLLGWPVLLQNNAEQLPHY